MPWTAAASGASHPHHMTLQGTSKTPPSPAQQEHRSDSHKPRFSPSKSSRFIYGGLVVAAIVLIAAIRIRLLGIPLERDEGEFAYMGQLMLQGIPPYALAANMKLPGTYAAYALIMALFGQTVEGIHLGLLVVNISTMLLVFVLTRRLVDDFAGVVACATYGLLSLGPGVQGTSAHATHFVLLPALGGMLLLLKAVEGNKPATLFSSGTLLGVAFIMKQPGIFFGLFALLYLLAAQIKKTGRVAKPAAQKALLLITGMLIPYLCTCAALYGLGVFKKFWFWTVLYASQYGSMKPLSDGIATFLARVPLIIDGCYLLWALAGMGVLILPRIWELRTQSFFIYGFLLFSFLAVCPGLYFREHYFILMLPAVALCTGIAMHYLKMRLPHAKALQSLPLFLFLICFFHGIYLQKLFFFTLSPAMACKYMYFPNPFPESMAIADYIETHSGPDSTIAVLGSEPQIYFYARRRSATSYLYAYSLMENHKYALTMQQEMIREIENSRPDYLIYVNIPLSWVIRPDSNMALLEWFKNYQKGYTLVGIVDILSPLSTKYLWDDQAQNYFPQKDSVVVLKRNSFTYLPGHKQ